MINLNGIQIGVIMIVAGAGVGVMVTFAACVGIYKRLRRKAIYKLKPRPPKLKERFRFSME